MTTTPSTTYTIRTKQGVLARVASPADVVAWAQAHGHETGVAVFWDRNRLPMADFLLWQASERLRLARAAKASVR